MFTLILNAEKKQMFTLILYAEKKQTFTYLDLDYIRKMKIH